jgi:sulfate/thiosulfate transport system permease protein
MNAFCCRPWVRLQWIPFGSPSFSAQPHSLFAPNFKQSPHSGHIPNPSHPGIRRIDNFRLITTILVEILGFHTHPVFARRKFSPLPGFGLSAGICLTALSLIVLIPLGGLALRTVTTVPAERFWEIISDRRALASYRLTFGASFISALFNAVFGGLLAWVLVRYPFPGRRLLDALVDIPFALPTAVAGLTLADLFSDHGWVGRWLAPFGIHGAYSNLGVVIALTFVGLPFSVRTLQPVIEAMDRDVEEAAATLGAGRWVTFSRVIFPPLLPGVLTGFALSFARAIGEYGSVIFIAGNQPGKSEITPLLIIIRLEEFDYAGAMSLAILMLGVSFALLIVINHFERWAARFNR